MSFKKLWHKSYASDVPVEINLEKITMAEVLTRTANKYPERVAFIYMGKKITFRQLEKLVNRFTRALIDMGVKQGDIVAMLLPNIPQIIIANHAAYRAGAVTAMNNPLYTERELTYQVKDSDATVLVTLDLLLPRVLKIRAKQKSRPSSPAISATIYLFPRSNSSPMLKRKCSEKWNRSRTFTNLWILLLSTLIRRWETRLNGMHWPLSFIPGEQRVSARVLC